MGAVPSKKPAKPIPVVIHEVSSHRSLDIICNTIQQEVGGKSIINVNYSVVHLSPEEVEEYTVQGRAQLTEAWRLIISPDWKVIKQIGDDIVYSMMYTKPGRKDHKIFKVICKVDHDAKAVMEDFWFQVDKIPEWDSALMESHQVCKLNAVTDITYQITNTSGSGLVTPRDFVNLRCWKLIEGFYVISHAATSYPTLPKTHKYIRGENGVSCVALQIDQSNASKSIMHLIVNTKLNGWIPQKAIDVAIVEVLFKYLENLREHIEDLRGVLHDRHPERRQSY